MLLYELDVRLNKVATLEHQSIPDTDKIIALNKAQLRLVKQKVSFGNNYNLGLDAFKKRYEDLQSLVVQDERVSLTKNQDVYTSYYVNVSSFANTYMFPISIVGMCSKGSCSNRPVVIQKIAKHADLHMMMTNSNYVPSFEYQESLSVISSDNIYIYTDGTFAVDYAYVTYIRYPQKIDIEGYIDLDGNPSVTADCELEAYLADELLDLAELEIAINTGNTDSVQGAAIRMKNNE